MLRHHTNRLSTHRQMPHGDVASPCLHSNILLPPHFVGLIVFAHRRQSLEQNVLIVASTRVFTVCSWVQVASYTPCSWTTTVAGSHHLTQDTKSLSIQHAFAFIGRGSSSLRATFISNFYAASNDKLTLAICPLWGECAQLSGIDSSYASQSTTSKGNVLQLPTFDCHHDGAPITQHKNPANHRPQHASPNNIKLYVTVES